LLGTDLLVLPEDGASEGPFWSKAPAEPDINNSNVIEHDFNSYVRDFVPDLDAFDPDERILLDLAQTVGIEVIPPLLHVLEDQGLQAVVGHDLATMANLFRSSGGRIGGTRAAACRRNKHPRPGMLNRGRYLVRI